VLLDNSEMLVVLLVEGVVVVLLVVPLVEGVVVVLVVLVALVVLLIEEDVVEVLLVIVVLLVEDVMEVLLVIVVDSLRPGNSGGFGKGPWFGVVCDVALQTAVCGCVPPGLS